MITINEPGARTLADARPMQIGGQNVYVIMDTDGTASLMVMGRIVATRQVQSISIAEAQAWAVEYRTAMDEMADAHQVEAMDHMAADRAVVYREAADVAERLMDERYGPDCSYGVGGRDVARELRRLAESKYTEAAAQVRAGAAELVAKAEAAEAHGNAPYKHRGTDGRVRTFTTSDPSHPARAAVSYRRDAEILAAWTAQDEEAYSRYVSDGIADTDGWFAPLDRAAWKGTLGR